MKTSSRRDVRRGLVGASLLAVVIVAVTALALLAGVNDRFATAARDVWHQLRAHGVTADGVLFALSALTAAAVAVIGAYYAARIGSEKGARAALQALGVAPGPVESVGVVPGQRPRTVWVVVACAVTLVLLVPSVAVLAAARHQQPVAIAPLNSFPTLPPGASLPSDQECAARVVHSPWEPRPQNATANHTTGTAITAISGANAVGTARFAPRIDGSFTGTTDEIIQWASCKWGFDTDIVRAVAAKESYWDQATVGDAGQSYGLLQVKRTVHTGTFPAARDSTAFNLDYALAWRRACFEGYFSEWIPNSARGDEWGCIGLWYSGSWNDAAANSYVESVQRILAQNVWLTWPDKS